jgi:U4/U6.U5 tri-snRNP component SNU23
MTDLRRLGQTTNIERSSVEQVRARIAMLREKTKEAAAAKAYDFEQRLQQIRDNELAERQAKRMKVKEEKAAVKAIKQEEQEQAIQANPDMMDMMGFAGFGTTKR